MPVLAAMGERETGRIGKTAGRAMHDFRHHGERRDRACTDTRRHEQILEILRPTIGGSRERAVQAAHVDVLLADIVMIRHDQMRQHRLRRRFSHPRGVKRDHFADDPVRTERGKQIELAAARCERPVIRQIDDLALPSAFDGRMG
ncbi:hypothetical protein D3C71_1770560 [compost metagenome]